MAKLTLALTKLLERINGGMEYPEAHTQVCTAFNLTDAQAEALTAAYDVGARPTARCADDCGMPAAPGSIYCADCGSAIRYPFSL